MDHDVDGSPPGEVAGEPESLSLSYKFQRLREKLREEIGNGMLAGKLPGERALAKRFHVNAKTLSKALTDLAAEGLLDRSIGRGTYVKGTDPAATSVKRWLVVCDPHQLEWEIISMLRGVQPELETITNVQSLRPSFLNQFSAVLDFSTQTPDSFIRELVVRNITVVLVGKEPRTYSTHAVVFDGPLAVMQAGRQLLLNGHRKLAAVEPAGCTIVADNLRTVVASRTNYDADVHSCFLHDATSMVNHGITAFVCHSLELARDLKALLDRSEIPVPSVSVVAVGSTPDDQNISGFFIRRSEKVKAITQLLNAQQTSRPTTIWLAGRFVDRGTLALSFQHPHLGSQDDLHGFHPAST